MSVHNLDIDALARLARLSVDADTHAELEAQIERILDFVDELSELDTEGVAAMAHPQDIPARLRPDAVTERDQRDKFLALAPESDEGHYLVPRVVE